MTQTWDPEGYRKHTGFVSDLGQPLVDLLAPRPGDHVLDLGCGDGELTQKLVEAGARVLGIDSSAEQAAAARERGLDARVMDARDLDFQGEFDAVLSNAALHWMTDLETVFRGVSAALKPGGRFVGEMGGRGNVAAICDALLAALDRRGIDGRALFPWVFPDPDELGTLLTGAGFRISSLELFERPTPLPTGIEGWLETMAGSFLSAVPEADRPAFIEDVAERLETKLRGADGVWFADYVRLRFAAIRA